MGIKTVDHCGSSLAKHPDIVMIKGVSAGFLAPFYLAECPMEAHGLNLVNHPEHQGRVQRLRAGYVEFGISSKRGPLALAYGEHQ